MQLVPVTMGLLDPLYQLFGWIMNHLYHWIGNYGVALIVFNVFLKLLVMPLSFKTQVGTLKQQFLQDDINEIKRIYAGNPQKAQEVTMDLQRQNGASMTAGCLPSILQMVILLAIWRPIQRPLALIAGVSVEKIQAIASYLFEQDLIKESVMKGAAKMDSGILAALNEHSAALGTAVENGWIQLRQVLDYNFLGMDLGTVPSIRPQLLFGAETWKVYVPLLVLVAVMIGTMFISMRLNKINMPKQRSKEDIAREKRNPAKSGQTPEQAEGMMKSMNVVMPVMMLFMSFTLPAAMALFWTSSNVVMIIQTLLSYYLYTKPARVLLDEAENRAVAGRRRKKA